MKATGTGKSTIYAALLALQILVVPVSASASEVAPVVLSSSNVNSADLLKWRVQQQQLYQLRSTLISEALARRLSSIKSTSATTLNIPTLTSVSTVDGTQPLPTDWECAISTDENPKSCLYSFDAPPNTKVIAPTGTTQWISLHALNRLRRLDPTKVEPMWHNQYTIRKSWFGTSETSVLQHIGVKGWFISSVLLDTPLILRALLTGAVLIALVAILPVLEYFFNAVVLNSSLVWDHYMNWARFVHAALPFKLLIAQMTWKFVATKFDALEKFVRDRIVDMECKILEETVPVTIFHGEASGDDDNDEESVVDFMSDEQETVDADEGGEYDSDD